MCIRKLLSIVCCIIGVIAVCCRIRHPREVITSPCLETSPCFEPPIHTYTYTPTYTVIVDTDGMEHLINPISIGPSGSSLLKDADGHTVIFYNNKFYHGLDRTQCIKCYELSRLPKSGNLL